MDNEEISTFVIFIFVSHTTDNISDTTGNMNKGAFFSQRKAGGYYQRESHCLSEQDSTAKEPMNDKTLSIR